MKSYRSIKSTLTLLGLIFAFAGATTVRADKSYLIGINTASIANNPAGPFYLDFQSLFGSGSAQTITLSDFSFTGGGWLPGTDSAIGAVSGGSPTSLVLNPSSASFYNEFYQQFSSGVTNLSFLATLTTNTSDITPTSFSVALLDSSLFNLPTTGVGDSLLLFDLDGDNTNYQTASTTGRTAGVTVSVSAVPEMTPTLALLLGVAALAAVWRRQQACQV